MSDIPPSQLQYMAGLEEELGFCDKNFARSSPSLIFWCGEFLTDLSRGEFQDYWLELSSIDDHHFRTSLMYWIQWGLKIPVVWTYGLTLLQQLQEVRHRWIHYQKLQHVHLDLLRNL